MFSKKKNKKNKEDQETDPKDSDDDNKEDEEDEEEKEEENEESGEDEDIEDNEHEEAEGSEEENNENGEESEHEEGDDVKNDHHEENDNVEDNGHDYEANDNEDREATNNQEESALVEVSGDDMPPKPPTPQKSSKKSKPPPPAPSVFNCFAKKPEVDTEYELRAMSARLIDRAGNKISLDLVLIWPCDVLTVKRKVAAQAGLTSTKFSLVLSAHGRLKDSDLFPEEGLHAMPEMHDEDETELEKLIRVAEEEKKEKERKENPPYICSAWAVISGILPGFKDPLLDDSDDGENDDGGGEEEVYDDDSSSIWDKSKRSNSLKAGGSSKTKSSKKKHKHQFDNTTSIGIRKKYFNLEQELSTINCEAYTDAVASLGVSEFSSFATLTVKELTVPGLGVPRPAANRIAELAKVYQKQMDAEDEEREAAALRAKQGRLKKKRQNFNEDVEEDMTVKDEVEEDDGDRGRFTVDGKFFFTSMKELKQVWGEASLVHRANLNDEQSLELSLAGTEVHADFSSVDGYHTEDLDSVAPPPPPPSVICTDPTEPDAKILDDYMKRLLRPATPEPPPPIELRPHRARTNKLIARILRRTAWDEVYEVPEHLDAQHRPRLACCPKHAIRSKFWGTSKGRDLRRAVANEVDVNLSAATKEGHGYLGDDGLFRVAKTVLDVFKVFIDPRDEKEIISDIILGANPNGETLGFSQRNFVEAITKLVVKQFQNDNPLLEFDENAANRTIRQKDIDKAKLRSSSSSNGLSATKMGSR